MSEARVLRLLLALGAATVGNAGCGKSPVPPDADATAAAKTQATTTGPTAPFAADRIPAGSWQCWMGRCDRRCNGMPGAAMVDGAHPEPVCARPKVAFCTTYTLQKDPHWECFPERVSCEANQRHYAAEAGSGRDYSAVSACTEAL
jgi:hypothetical protein